MDTPDPRLPQGASECPPAKKNQIKKKNQKKKRSIVDFKWIFSVFGLSFAIAVVLGFLSQSLEDMDVFLGFLVLLLVIFLGVIFDFIGIAVASADAGNFHSMAARGNPAGVKGVWLVKNADKVASFCNDVIGDIAGVLSGAIGASLSVQLFLADNPWGFWGDLLLTGCISAITVGGKAVFKGLAMEHAHKTVSFLCRVLCLFSCSDKKKQKQQKKKRK